MAPGTEHTYNYRSLLTQGGSPNSFFSGQARLKDFHDLWETFNISYMIGLQKQRRKILRPCLVRQKLSHKSADEGNHFWEDVPQPTNTALN